MHGEFANSRDLLLNLVRAELSARYKTPVFGLLWFLLSPLVMAAVLMAVFQHLIHLPIERYPVFLLAALLPWTFFQMGLSNATTSLVRSAALVKRVRIPRMLVPLSAVVASLVHLLVSLLMFVLILLAIGRAPGPGPLLVLPVLVLVELACVAGLGLAASALNVLYRDVEHLVAMVLRFGFWLTPIFYPLDYVPAEWRGVARLNPMAGLLDGFRAVLLHDELPAAGGLAGAALASAALLAAGVLIFRRLDPSLDDHV
jgi:ABC-type polysaccharide/polyol phosphate export permease